MKTEGNTYSARLSSPNRFIRIRPEMSDISIFIIMTSVLELKKIILHLGHSINQSIYLTIIYIIFKFTSHGRQN